MDGLVGNIVSCVERRILQDEEVSVGAVSRELGFTRQYVSGRFHRTTGNLLSHYLKERRLDKAARLLREKKMRVSQVSRLCGFDSENYYRQQFKLKFGMSPRQFRAKGDLSVLQETAFPDLAEMRLRIRKNRG